MTRDSGFTLMEVTVAMLIASIVLVGAGYPLEFVGS